MSRPSQLPRNGAIVNFGRPLGNMTSAVRKFLAGLPGACAREHVGPRPVLQARDKFPFQPLHALNIEA